jgi:DNA-binding NarL/FixJ family response regulator
MPTCAGSVIIIDKHHLRRDCFAALVRPWATALGMETISICPDDLPGIDLLPGDVQLTILNVGAASLHDIEQTAVIDLLTRQFPDSPCAILSDRADPEEALVACRLGRKAFVSSDLNPDLVLKAFSFLMNGGTYFPLETLLLGSSGELTCYPVTSSSRSLDREQLTKRQADVLDGLRRGKSNKLIARELKMQESTVKVHVRQIMRKLGAHNRTQAALLAQAHRDVVQPASLDVSVGDLIVTTPALRQASETMRASFLS